MIAAPKLTDPIHKMSANDIKRALKEIDEYEKEVEKELSNLKAADPFWFYEPSSGDISPEAMAFLKRHLKQEDIPAKMVGQMDVHKSNATIRFVSGGNQCLGGETKIFDPVAQTFMRVEQIKSSFHVQAWDGERIVAARARAPYKKEADELFRFDLSNGQSFVASLGHRVLNGDVYVSCGQLRPGYALGLPGSISEPCLEAHVANGLRFFGKVLGSQAGCPFCLRSCGEQLLTALGIGRDVFPLPAYALAHMGQDAGRMGGPGNTREHTRSCLCERPHANRDGQGRTLGHDVGTGRRNAWPAWKSFYRKSQGVRPLLDALIRPFRSMFGSAGQATPFSSPLVVTNVTYLRRDVKYDFEVPVFHNYLASGVVHHNSGKTTCTCIEAIIAATGALPKALEDDYPPERVPRKFPQYVRVVGKDWQNGILLNVLPTFQRWVPREYLKDWRWDKSYSAEKATLYLSKGGELKGTIEFMSNAQDVTSFQGPPRDCIIYDEEPRRDIYKENLLRFSTRDRLNIMFGMTPTEGLTWIYDDIVNKGEDGMGNSVEIFRISSVANRLANLRVLDEIMGSLSEPERKMRLLGEFISLSGLVYGRTFDRRIHVIPRFDVTCNCETPEDHQESCAHSRYYVIRGLDPHLVTPTATVWVALDKWENAYVVTSRFEERDVEEVKGMVAEISKGMRLGWSTVDSAADSNIEAFGGLNIYRKLTTGRDRIKALRLAPKGHGSIRSGVDEIKQYLALNPISKRPRLFVFDVPENRPLIHAFETMERDRYANEDKRGMKDKISESKHHLHAALRYIFAHKLRFREAGGDAPVEQTEYAPEEVYA